MGNVIRIRSRAMRARPVCIQESENFWRKVARTDSKENAGGKRRESEVLRDCEKRRRNRRDVISTDDNDGDGGGDGDGEIEERKGCRERRFYSNVYQS